MRRGMDADASAPRGPPAWRRSRPSSLLESMAIFRPLLEAAADKAGFLKALDADFSHLRAVGVSHPDMEKALRALGEGVE